MSLTRISEGGPPNAQQADKEQDTKEAQRLISIAENWITLAKKIGDATALSSRLHRQTQGGLE
jgi:hypothetical protein